MLATTTPKTLSLTPAPRISYSPFEITQRPAEFSPNIFSFLSWFIYFIGFSRFPSFRSTQMQILHSLRKKIIFSLSFVFLHRRVISSHGEMMLNKAENGHPLREERKMSATFYDWIIDKKMSQIAFHPCPCDRTFLCSCSFFFQEKPETSDSWRERNYGKIMNPSKPNSTHETSQNWHWFLNTFSNGVRKKPMRKCETKTLRSGKGIDVEEISFRFTLLEVEVKKAQK